MLLPIILNLCALVHIYLQTSIPSSEDSVDPDHMSLFYFRAVKSICSVLDTHKVFWKSLKFRGMYILYDWKTQV